MLALVLATLAGGADVQLPDADLRDSLVAVEPAPDERRVSVWLQPVAMTVAPIATTAANVGTYFAVPLGATLVLERLTLSFETTFSFYKGSGSAFVGGDLSVGPMFHTGETPLNGFFVTPKLSFHALHELTRNKSTAAFMAGVDAGWQHTFGALYLALMLGVSAGWSFADNDFIQGPGIGGPPGFGNDIARPVIGANLNLLRIGFAL